MLSRRFLPSKLKYRKITHIQNAIFFHPLGEIFSFGGDDKVLKFFSLSFQNSQPIPELIWEHDEHPGPIRNIDYNGFDLYVSSDKMTAVISNLKNKQIIRKVYNDQLLPQSTFLQSA